MAQELISRVRASWAKRSLRSRAVTFLSVVGAVVILAFLVEALIDDGSEPREIEVQVAQVVEQEATGVVTQTESGLAETAEHTGTEDGAAAEATAAEEVTALAEAEAVNDEEASRMGGWLDRIVFVQEPNADVAVARLAAGDMDLYAADIGSQATVQTIQKAGEIQTRVQYGLYDEIFFNNGVCADEKLLNPFNNARIREAMNWAIDRSFIVDEIYGGLAVPKFTPIKEAGSDRAKFAPEIRLIESKYAYDFDRAKEVIKAEMEAMGATLEEDAWTFAGRPASLIFLIRTEDARLQIGNYVASQLEEMGFTVERIEGVASGLGPIWIGSDPADCQWHLYTGAWGQEVIDRSSVDSFEFFYTPRGIPWPSWEVFEPTPELDDLALRLSNNVFTTMEERAGMVREALPLAIEMSTRVWTTSRTTLVAFRDEIAVTSDLAAGVVGALWPRTIRITGEIGGSMTIGLPSALNEPWNPIAGAWIFDAMIRLGLSDAAFYSDPSTGLYIPGRAEGGELVVQEGFPVRQSLDWVKVTTAPEIVVPDDAWVDWDAANQIFLTAAEVYTEPQTAVFKSTVTYPADMFEKVTWHDGSPISVADFIMGMIKNFDLAKEESAYYDESLVPGLQQFQDGFRGFRIASTDPLIIEHWGNDAQLDAENSVHGWWPGGGAWGAYGSDTAWHNFGLMLRGEANGSFAFTVEKAAALGIERANMIAGSSLGVIAAELALASEEGRIPYAPTLSQYITAEEAAVRYGNLGEFGRRYGHYCLGTGPYYLSELHLVEGQVVLTHYDAHPDLADRFAEFAAPALPVVEIDGEGRVTIGDETTFDIFVDNPVSGGPYAIDDIESVSYLLLNATGELVEQGAAEAVEDGLWQVTMSSETSSTLEEGSNRLEVVIVSRLVALPSLSGAEFVSFP